MKQRIAMWALLGALLSGPALAEGPVKIGYVDMRTVLTESKAGQKHRAELEKFIKDKQAGFKKEEDKLNEMGQAFQKEQLTLSDAQKQEKQRGLQEKAQALQKAAQEAERELRTKDSDYTNKAIEEIRKVITEVAKAEKMNIVFGKLEMSVLYADDSMDLTKKVIEKYDSRTAKK